MKELNRLLYKMFYLHLGIQSTRVLKRQATRLELQTFLHDKRKDIDNIIKNTEKEFDNLVEDYFNENTST